MLLPHGNGRLLLTWKGLKVLEQNRQVESHATTSEERISPLNHANRILEDQISDKHGKNKMEEVGSGAKNSEEIGTQNMEGGNPDYIENNSKYPDEPKSGTKKLADIQNERSSIGKSLAHTIKCHSQKSPIEDPLWEAKSVGNKTLEP